VQEPGEPVHVLGAGGSADFQARGHAVQDVLARLAAEGGQQCFVALTHQRNPQVGPEMFQGSQRFAGDKTGGIKCTYRVGVSLGYVGRKPEAHESALPCPVRDISQK